MIGWRGFEQRAQRVAVDRGLGTRLERPDLDFRDRRGLVAPIETAVRGRIPVVVIDSGVESKAPVSFVATDNYKGGGGAAGPSGAS